MGPARRATIADVAARAGVHAGTASRALNERTRGMVNADTVERVVRSAAELGYVPNALARGLRTSSSMTIGVVIPDIMNPFFPPMVRGIEARVEPHGYSTLIANSDGFESGESGAVRSLLDRRVDGLIIASAQRDESSIARLHDAGVKVVLLNRDAGDVPYPLVTSDVAGGITEAVSALHRLGHRSLLHLAGPTAISTCAARIDAFEAAVDATPGMTGRIVTAAALSIDAGYAAMLEFLRNRDHGVTGVIATNDLVALGILRAMRRMRVDCPGEISVIGYNDIPFAEDFCPPLSSIRVPTTTMGATAADLLLEDLQQDTRSGRTITLPVSVILRGSTAPARAVS